MPTSPSSEGVCARPRRPPSVPTPCVRSSTCAPTSRSSARTASRHRFGLSTPDPDEAAVKSAIVRAARRVVVVADADKLGNELLVSFAPLEAIDVLVTDAAPDPVLAAALSDAQVEVWLA